jgi:hypothetical protein
MQVIENINGGLRNLLSLHTTPTRVRAREGAHAREGREHAFVSEVSP